MKGEKGGGTEVEEKEGESTEMVLMKFVSEKYRNLFWEPAARHRELSRESSRGTASSGTTFVRSELEGRGN
jgi:hypothetical protein